MRALILSCNTGGGHNSAGLAMKEAFERAGHEAEFLDYMCLKSEKTSKRVGNLYVETAKHIPHVFGVVYQLGRLVSNSHWKGPVYYANRSMGKYIRDYLQEHPADVILTPHLYPAETVTYLRRQGMLPDTFLLFVGTDYTCVPFTEELECDGYVIPHEDCKKEYIHRGVPKEKLIPLGIPVSAQFNRRREKAEVREILGLPQNAPLYLIMSGSMGFGRLVVFMKELVRRLVEEEQVVVICGTNEKMKQRLKRLFGKNPQVHITGYTSHVARFMDACDVLFTKPGGLTSTEAAVKKIPMVHTAPIPGCENRNLAFFQERGMSVSAKTILGQIHLGQKLVREKSMEEAMVRAQESIMPKEAADEIVAYLENTLGGKKR